MSGIDDKSKNELNHRKEVLNKHLAKFNQLKNECRWSEAWNQLLVALNYANDTLKYSTNLLKNISQKKPDLSADQRRRIDALTNRINTDADGTGKKIDVISEHDNIF